MSSQNRALAEAPAPRPSKRKKLSRAEKSQKIRQSLFEAAAKVVGEQGYSNAMVASITARADVAQGTFYNYFESRQDIFDQLLPSLGEAMLAFIKDRSKDAPNEIEREEQSFRAFFAFLKTHPEFYRILYEAEVFAPAAYQRHMETVSKGYCRVLQRARDRGALKVRDNREIETIAYILMGARQYLSMRYARRDGQTIALPEWVVRAYMSLVKGGLFEAERG